MQEASCGAGLHLGSKSRWSTYCFVAAYQCPGLSQLVIFVAGVKFVQRSLERGKEGRVGAWLAVGVHPGMFVKVTLDFNFTSLTFSFLFSLSPRTVDAGVSYVSDVPPHSLLHTNA